ncbi:MAG: hydrogenobyrinic acid a,c-diamide synthase (glutamine-hydrolyzing) [Thermodesulfovibrionia bacterium]
MCIGRFVICTYTQPMVRSTSYRIPRVILSGLRGGSGKTILSLCILSMLKERNLKVIPFKKGPDFIDAGWLSLSAKGDCYNLDLFMMSSDVVMKSFISHTKGADIAIIEGNRGLYDGMDSKGTYSTAGLAKILKSPVIIVVDCSKVTTTISAMILGCMRFDPDVNIRGVLLNNLANKRQESVIRDAITERCAIPVLGAIPRFKDNPLPERHMGLTPFHEHRELENAIERIRSVSERYIDVDSVLKIARDAEPLIFDKQDSGFKTHGRQFRIGIIRDSAFQFYYPENIEELQKMGALLVEISAVNEGRLPHIDALYIGGGFPETHAHILSENTGFRGSLKDAIEKGLPVYAECGGLMYLGRELIMDNKRYPMVGALPLIFKVEDKPQAHGYTIVEVERENPYFSKGVILRGHEFHYSHVIDGRWDDVYLAFRLKRGKGIKDGMDGICYKNVLATYTHLHALGSPEWVNGMIKVCGLKTSVLPLASLD